MKKAAPFLLIIALAALALFIKKCKENRQPETTAGEQTKVVNRNRGFDRRISFLKYTRHAKCRMECRQISKQEVEAIMQNGKINYNKSNISGTRCPVYALEGITADKQRVRIVFGQCDDFTNVITVIDLDNEWSCHCDGDDNKFENRN